MDGLDWKVSSFCPPLTTAASGLEWQGVGRLGELFSGLQGAFEIHKTPVGLQEAPRLQLDSGCWACLILQVCHQGKVQ